MTEKPSIFAGMAWPRHADGSPKRLGDCTPEEQRQLVKDGAERVKRDLESPAAQSVLRAYLADPPTGTKQ